MRWTPQMVEAVTTLWNAGLSKKEIRRSLNLTTGQLEGARMRLNLHAQGGRPLVLSEDHPAVVQGRSLFRSVPELRLPLLKPGLHSPKLGNIVAKGRWRGMRLFSLTLEERRTCPRSCTHWHDCYGNHMRWAARQPHGQELVDTLARELAALAEKHAAGFVVRLHVLGDFYSIPYVEAWHRWLGKHQQLHVFGYTAHQPGTPIGDALLTLRRAYPARWWVRHSDGPPHVLRTGPDGITCPAQTGKSKSCATCALCWTTPQPINFMAH